MMMMMMMKIEDFQVVFLLGRADLSQFVIKSPWPLYGLIYSLRVSQAYRRALLPCSYYKAY